MDATTKITERARTAHSGSSYAGLSHLPVLHCRVGMWRNAFRPFATN